MNDMEVQNAAESDESKPAADAAPRADERVDQDSVDGKGQHQRRAAESVQRPSASVSSAINKPRHANPTEPSSAAAPCSEHAPDDPDSDAETIVLPGKGGHSPSKARSVRQEDRSESDGDGPMTKGQTRKGSRGDDSPLVTSGRPDDLEKKDKRRSGFSTNDRDRQRSNKEGSSGLSSAPTSPSQQHSHRSAHQDHSRLAINAVSSPSDSEHSSQHKLSPKSSVRDKIKPSERSSAHKRKAFKVETDDEGEGRKARRQRTMSGSLERVRTSKDGKSTSSKHQDEQRVKSASPPPRLHRRSASTQHSLQAANGQGQKKRHLPPPLHSTDYQSDESSASGSPHPRTAKLRSSGMPAGAEPNASPAKMGPHKKHLDAHGQTLLARACARGEYDVAKQRLGERPEDLNVADYAGNTPLQIAAINGCETIVKLLIDAGCNTDCVNYDKDTPLLDAVDNGHLGVVQLLLDAGVNPRKANVNGEEPIDRVTEDTDNAAEIRAALLDARKRAGGRRRTSEERASHQEFHDARDSHAPESPRHSPAATASSALGRRSGTVRATKTRNDLLYMPLDEKTLRQAAGRGDEETVARILQVKEGYDDPESMVAAARGGHDLVIQLLLGLGGANPDPEPISGVSREFATPILAAIGQENMKVLELLLEQQGFDPTKRFCGETYYEIARARQGTNWKEEEHLLRKAYDEFKHPRKVAAKTKSPARREERRAVRDDADSSSQRHTLLSPTREAEHKKKSSKISSPREKKRSSSFSNLAEESTARRGSGRSKREDRISSLNTSDRELSSQKPLKSKRAESDAAGLSSEGEAAKPRRKLISKAELRDERERQRRASMTSNASNETSSPQASRNEELREKSKLGEKRNDRTKGSKADGSVDVATAAVDGTTKRHRTSVTPDKSGNGEKNHDGAPPKRRRLEGQGQENRSRQNRTAELESKSLTQDDNAVESTRGIQRAGKDGSDDEKERERLHRRESGRSNGSDRSIHVKSEDVDFGMPDADSSRDGKIVQDIQNTSEQMNGEHKSKPTEDDVSAKKLAEEEAKKKEDLQRVAAEREEARRKQEEEEIQKKNTEENEEAERKQKSAEEKRRREEEEERQRVAEEQRRRVEEELRQRQAEEQRQREVEERRKREEEDARRVREQQERERREAEEARLKMEEEERRRQEEEEKRQREEEEERLRKEQIEREAAEQQARRQREEERKERERLHREEVERKRAAREAELRRIREEQERARLDKLPPLLRWLDTCPNPKTPLLAAKLGHVQGVRYDTICSEADLSPEGREQWLVNTDVALLLGEKDLDLSRCEPADTPDGSVWTLTLVPQTHPGNGFLFPS